MQRSRRDTATCDLFVLKRLDTKLPDMRVILGLVELYLGVDLVVQVFDGGEKVVREQDIEI